ncbi:putative gamma-glutamylcyclotransferase CG2811 isoform X2 [Penaeus japonicus]|uniref:putative gamma-glutamylcyclotransferase CG2811 isoform X2 n=1 Tax=Penaeus japonicus TaxID=27405 RepID=UPI001C70D196|nr:putative gamma-glutamylcyclotransferase CG2811 isoform X2 [Penaeus japonicus]
MMQFCSRTMSRNLVFVYGSLKQTQPNHHWLTDKENGEARLRGLATTQERYPLVVASRYNIPYVLASPGKGKQIEGELYEVDDQMLAKLDILEVHPKYYERKMIKASIQESKEVVDCWIYLLHHFRPELLKLPHLSTYFSKGDFVPRHLRDIQGSEYWADVKLPEGL